MSLRTLRTELSHPRISVQLCLLSAIAGVCAASLIILFRLSYEWLQAFYLGGTPDFIRLHHFDRFIMPIVGAQCILLFAFITRFKVYRLGVPYVIHRLKERYGYMPLRSTLNQFFGGVFALAGGFSVGREGPSVHLGAAGSTFFGRWLGLPNNSIRILAGCGIAAGISASFNTPFAAVIFVMEVVLREYRTHIFIPVMLAAAIGSVMTRMVFGEVYELDFLSYTTLSPSLYLYLVIMGVALGALAAGFNNSLMAVMRWFRPVSMTLRLTLAGAITGALAYLVPQAMGSGLHLLGEHIAVDASLIVLLSLIVAKYLMTLFALGLGVPGGIIGPVMGLGILAGTLLSYPLYLLDITDAQDSLGFALLGLAGMLTAVLHAPLSALSAAMELANNPNIILPAMLVIVPAYVVSTQLFHNQSIFIRQLDFQQLSYANSSVKDALQKIGVLSVMNESFRLAGETTDAELRQMLDDDPDSPVVVPGRFDPDSHFALIQLDLSLNTTSADCGLIKTPMQALPAQATLAEAYDLLQASRSGAVYIYEEAQDQVIGILTWDKLRHYLIQEQY